MIARALMHRPQVLFLDEPSTGLDPQARLFVWDRVRELRDDGVTVVLTTHDMDEATALCDRVGVVDHGRLLALDTPAALVRSLPGSGSLDLGVRGGDVADDQLLLQQFTDLPDVESAEVTGSHDDTVQVRLYVTGEPSALLGPVASTVQRSGASLVDVLFALVITPLIFTGCKQYPWPLLASLRWFQVVTLFNPLTYVSESMRAAAVTGVPHMSVWVCVPVMLACTVLFIALGLVGFRRRALD